MACGFAGITWQWRRTENHGLQAVQALNSATDTVFQSLVKLHTTPWENCRRRLRTSNQDDPRLATCPDRGRGSCLPRVTQFPRLRVHRLAETRGPRPTQRGRAECSSRRRGWSSRSWHAKILPTRGFGTTLARCIGAEAKLVAGARALRRSRDSITVDHSLSGKCKRNDGGPVPGQSVVSSRECS